MARPRSDEKREAIMAAAIRIIASQGLSAPTALIAKEAGVSNGALFTYFETKSDLINQLYLHLKAGMAHATMTGLPLDADLRGQMRHRPRHPAVAFVAVAPDLLDATRAAASESYAGIAALLERSRAHGALRDAPLMFVGAMVVALLDATVNYMTQDEDNALAHAATGFTALWRILA
jgi:AcrR family transcriptional regulator